MQFSLCALLCALLPATALAATTPPADESAPPPDPGWPRVFTEGKYQLTVYQPQVDEWRAYRDLNFRCAIAVKTPASRDEVFGVAEVTATTVVDTEAREVAVQPVMRVLRFPNLSESEEAALNTTVDALLPPRRTMILALDRLLAYLDPAQAPLPDAKVNFEPPRIFHSAKPAVLVVFIGPPEFKPVAKESKLLFAINTNWDVFFDSTHFQYYLLNGDNWLTTPDLNKGPWSAATALPAELKNLPDEENWADVRKSIPGTKVKTVPTVFATSEPSELILTQGEPTFDPIPGTHLMQVRNTESPLFLHAGEGQFYFLVAGRWYRGKSLDGPWSAATRDLPADFLNIPDDHPAAFVKASVKGTREASDAVLLASIPRLATVNVGDPNVAVAVTYDGDPKFLTIPNTVVQYAVNSPYSVFFAAGGYYCCYQGVWFNSATASGPWGLCSVVPAAIYTIPPTHPTYNVTYVVVQQATPTTVVYASTSGYEGQYVSDGVLMFGMGIAVGAIIANNWDNSYWHWHYAYHCHAHFYSYGCGAVYSYGHGGFYRSAHVYGPYGGAGRVAAYNPHTGGYARGAYRYGPNGAAFAREGYNPYTDTYAARAGIKTPYGSSGRFYANRDGREVWGGHESGARGSVAWAQNDRGGKVVAGEGWRGNQGIVAKGNNGNIYAGKDGNIYRRNSNGDWSVNSGRGWQDPPRPTPRASATASPTNTRTSPPARPSTQPAAASRSSSATFPSGGARATPATGASFDQQSYLNRDAQARNWGSSRASQQSSGSGRSRGGDRGGGGRR